MVRPALRPTLRQWRLAFASSIPLDSIGACHTLACHKQVQVKHRIGASVSTRALAVACCTAEPPRVRAAPGGEDEGGHRPAGVEVIGRACGTAEGRGAWDPRDDYAKGAT